MISRYPWRLWGAQIAAILRLEVKRSLASRRAIAVYLLASMPVFVFALHAVAHLEGWGHCNGREDLMAYATVFQIFSLRLAVFFGCVVVFLNLFRGEVLEKTLHYYFLAPVRREVVVVGKYLAGVVTTVTLFGASTFLSYLILCQHLALTENRAVVPWALGHTAAYVGVTVLACLGYGAVFLALGMLFRNPIVPAISVLVWELFIVFYPPVLKKISVIFYLESLCPVRVPFDKAGQLFAIPADPTPVYLAVPGLLLLTAAVLVYASLRVRKMEINYGME